MTSAPHKGRIHEAGREHRFSRNPDVEQREIDDTVFLVNPMDDTIFSLNALSAGIWRLLATPVTHPATGASHGSRTPSPQVAIPPANTIAASGTASKFAPNPAIGACP